MSSDNDNNNVISSLFSQSHDKHLIMSMASNQPLTSTSLYQQDYHHNMDVSNLNDDGHNFIIDGCDYNSGDIMHLASNSYHHLRNNSGNNSNNALIAIQQQNHNHTQSSTSTLLNRLSVVTSPSTIANTSNSFGNSYRSGSKSTNSHYVAPRSEYESLIKR
ncbi:hypothetical protein BLA29_009844 [Euroglyphus maynei]|uniref:Uncharacterized protein n=1 Tax=Euroglyphus maynei TaxID=6958 RepID=A0A1Y3B5V8_EURMA|nr:hypothetical protein BLA29_009844 [Euroglyphus maynei]